MQTFKGAKHDFELHTFMTATAKKLLVAAVEPIFINELRHITRGFADVDVWTIVNHLKTTYAIVSPHDITENRNRLRAPINVDEPIENVWLRSAECLQFAAANNAAIADVEATEDVFKAFKATGVFGPAVDAWEMQADALKTFANLKVMFNRVNNTRINNAATTGPVYHGAHAVTPTKPPHVNTAAGSGTATTPTAGVDNKGGTLCWYCHTHGTGFSPNHTSANCRHPSEDPKNPHNAKATIKNKMNGNTGWQSEMRRSPRIGTPVKEE
jgi:hypothetical protein